jgi:glucose-6-phosphate-specific signal transduction histidine kinase
MVRKKVKHDHHKITWQKLAAIGFIAVGASLLFSSGSTITGSTIAQPTLITSITAVGGIVLVILGLAIPLTE